MAKTNRHGSRLLLAILAVALGGCAAIDRLTTAGAPQRSDTATLGSSGTSPFMRAGLQPFTLADCMKFEAVPQECERTVNGGQ